MNRQIIDVYVVEHMHLIYRQHIRDAQYRCTNSPDHRDSPRRGHVPEEILRVVRGKVLLVHDAVPHPAPLAVGCAAAGPSYGSCYGGGGRGASGTCAPP